MSDDFFAELNSEIAAATAKKLLKSDAAKLKKQALNTRLSEHTRRRARAEYESLQAIVEANQWEVVCCGILFAEQSCDGCGSIHYNFLQYMQQEQKVRDPHSRRWTRIPVPVHGMELETIIQPLTTHICSDCCADHGFNILTPTIRLMPHSGALTVGSNYIQEDINGSTEET